MSESGVSRMADPQQCRFQNLASKQENVFNDCLAKVVSSSAKAEFSRKVVSDSSLSYWVECEHFHGSETDSDLTLTRISAL